MERGSVICAGRYAGRAALITGGAYVLTVAAPPGLGRYLIPKGSVAVDGVSLTLVDVGGPGGSSPKLAPHEFTLWLIPHTLQVTTLGELAQCITSHNLTRQTVFLVLPAESREGAPSRLYAADFSHGYRSAKS